MKKQILTVHIDDTVVTTSWMNAAIRVHEYRSGVVGPAKECVIKIREPADLRYLRQRLDEIEAYWARELAASAPQRRDEHG